MPVERFNDYYCRIPPPWVQPIRQTAHRVAAIPAHVPPHPDDNPSLTQAADLTAVETVPLYAYSSAIPPIVRIPYVVPIGGGFRLAVSPKKAWASITAFPPKKDGNHPNQNFKACVL